MKKNRGVSFFGRGFCGGFRTVQSFFVLLSYYTTNMADFQIGICDCCMDCGICCLGWCFPCYLTAVNLARVDGRQCSACDCCCQTNPMWVVRNRIRTKYGLQYQYCSDCCLLIWCDDCANCQHANEMRVREKGTH